MNLLKVFYSAYVGMVGLVTLLPVYLLVRIADRRTAQHVCQVWARTLQVLSFNRSFIVGKVPIANSPMIFAANHASYIDPIFLLPILPPNTLFVGKAELLRTPIIRTFIRKLGFLTVDRLDFSKGLEDTKQIESALKSGSSIMIFPEGTFGYAEGLRPFRLGAFKVAAETNVAICPIALRGTRTILRDDEKLLRPSNVTITICEPIQPRGSEWQDVTWLRSKVRDEIGKYCGEPSLDFIAAQTIASHES